MKRRQGFTLVELLVSMALIIFIMAILSQAFGAAMNTFRSLKSAGDMAEKLRATTQILYRDLAADHFEGHKRLSDESFWLNGPPQQGFFRIWQSSPQNYVEGTDVDGIGSYLSDNHYLAFTIKLNGNEMSDFLSASALGGGTVMSTITAFNPPGEARYQLTSGGAYNYQWAEVTWFLQPSGETTVADPSTGSPPVALYTLYRRQRLLVPNNSLVQPAQPAANLQQFEDVSCWPDTTTGNLHFNSPLDITTPWRRFGMMVPPSLMPQNPEPSDFNYAGLLASNPYYPTLAQQGAVALSGADIQLTDVVSFDVRVYVSGVSNGIDPFVPLTNLASYSNSNPAFPAGTMVFDTWSQPHDHQNENYSYWSQLNPPTATTIPMWRPFTVAEPMGGPIIKAIQVTIRIWDYKTNQTRQVTVVQAM